MATSSGGSEDTTTGGEPDTCTFEDTFDVDACPADAPTSCEVYVDGSVDASGDGQSWAGAFKTVQEGIDAAYCAAQSPSACEQREVWVRAGTYYLYDDCDLASLRLRDEIALYGGFAGTEAARDERDWVANETILDGRAEPDGADALFHVVVGADGALLDGFIVQGGAADDETEGVHQYGGGMLNEGVSPIVDNCTFRNNFATWGGAGISTRNASVAISNSSFDSNFALEVGGGVFNFGSTATVNSSSFTGNTAQGMLMGWGGGGIANMEGSDATVSDVLFVGNSGNRGGGMWCVHSEAMVSDVIFDGNFASHGGGGLNMQFGIYSAERVVFSGNSASNLGGALSVGGEGSYDVTNCLMYGNVSTFGGAIEAGGAGPVSLVHCTIARNTAASSGGAVYDAPDLTIINSILDNPDNDGEITDAGGPTTTTVSYSDVIGGWPGMNNIDEDPLFVDFLGGDISLTMDSPCIDTADPASAPPTDTAGNPRVGPPDMGGLEFQ